MRVLVTGAAGFIGSHFVRHAAEHHPDWEILAVESFNYASALDRIADLRTALRIFHQDLRAPFPDFLIRNLGELDYIFHFGAETHVDKSLMDPLPFVQSNILGTFHLLEYCRNHQPRLRMFFYISTDEVYGPAPPGVDHVEGAPHRPSNPYAATKAAAEDLCYAWEHSMGVPIVIVNTMNNIGEMQHAEKFVPKVIRALNRNEVITVHGSPDTPGSRKYLYTRDHAKALDFLMGQGRRGGRYNVVGQEEVNNLELVRKIERIMGAEAKIKFVDFHSARPGHDHRYSLSGVAMKELGWEPSTSIDTALRRVVNWTLAHSEWL
jgi:dTDP-glucose 4,6-dehydratase